MNLTTAQEEVIEAAFEQALTAFEEDPEAYPAKRGAFRVAVIEAVETAIERHCEVYIHAAGAAMDNWEAVYHLVRWLRSQGLPSNVSREFLHDIRIPAPVSGLKDYIDGRQAPPFQGKVVDFLTDDALAIFDGKYPYGREVPPPPPRDDLSKHRSEPREYNAPLGNG